MHLICGCEASVRHFFHMTGGVHSALYAPHFRGLIHRDQSFTEGGRLKLISPKICDVLLFTAYFTLSILPLS